MSDTTPTPAPAMTAERLAQLRAICDDEWGREIFAHIDALTAALKETERMALAHRKNYEAMKASDAEHFARALAAEAQLKEARRLLRVWFDDETDCGCGDDAEQQYDGTWALPPGAGKCNPCATRAALKDTTP